jgi:Arc/MetJ-type ribon-helix-helix transcriptional regulator
MTTERFSIGMGKDLYDWLEAQIKSGTFYSRRHGIEFALSRLKTQWEKQEKRQKDG